MKSLRILLAVALAAGLSSCEKDDNPEFADYLVARPLTMTLEDFSNSLDIVAPQPIAQSGKIYAYADYVFVNEPYKGVHVIDNSNPASPRKTGFIRIPGNVDISVKGDYLFADSLSDLVVLDISDMGNIRPVARLEGVLQSYFAWPLEADLIEYGDWDPQTEIQVGWEVTSERRRVEEVRQRMNEEVLMFADAASADTGQGGSLARFKIVADYLYAVDSHTINVFDISDLEAPVALEDVFAGFDIETIFNYGDHLFLGSMRGMYIYDITAPATPTFVSEFQHGTACDPVVVDGQYAYVTLRGGNGCGALESGLFIVDISDITRPELAVQYPLDEPYGLGLKGTQLFVCDGSSGLKVYDKTDIMDLQLLGQFQEVDAYDVIPLQERLLMVGDGELLQYSYSEAGLEWVSTLSLKD
ncbi:LVIVD repeat-containing protein [Robiginitalea sediminis]|uniref:LVIVD repeat-containing protein n=1 Tax=Robiginitalea sediminis TaxID=1982593 RepID=UPI000B4AD772|nr:hypothetical protein [Robiginitalea sediminis]